LEFEIWNLEFGIMARKQNIVREKSFSFALTIIQTYKKLIDEKEYIISKQLLRSGTSIGANIEESGAAFSRADFTYKITLAAKEARETRYWLLLLNQSELTNIDLSNELREIEEIINILSSIISTIKYN
jgi:four helix bundle protein